MKSYEIEEKIINDVKSHHYKADEFTLYCAEAGWEDWMNDYTEAKEDEECSSSELKAIQRIQAEAFVKAFPDEKLRITETYDKVLVDLV